MTDAPMTGTLTQVEASDIRGAAEQHALLLRGVAGQL